MKPHYLPLLLPLLIGGCTLMPAHERPAVPVPESFANAGAANGVSAAGLDWQDLVRDARLREVIGHALAGNRDLRIASLNIERAQAQYQIRDAGLYPTLAANAGETAQRLSPSQTGGAGRLSRNISVGLGVSAWELDLFGRLRSLKAQALASYMATQEAQRATRLSLISETANAWLALAADQELLHLAEETLRSRRDSLDLVSRSQALGVASDLDLAQAQTSVESARADVATYTSVVSRDRNALMLLCGGDLPANLLPDGLPPAVSDLDHLPADLPAQVLLQRPDVLAAEDNLRAAEASIGAARAAYFPTLTLTGSYGTASNQLSGLFNAGNGVWSFVPQLSLPLFDGGRLRAGLMTAKVDRKLAVAQYEKTIQTAFREVSDALADQATLDERLAARTALVQAGMNSYRLSEARYRAGVDNHLTLLDAQRTLYAAQQSLVATRQARLANLFTVYKVLGGGTAATEASH